MKVWGIDEKTILNYNLQFFAEGPGGEKTEKATPRKREKAREEGQVIKSNEINTAAMLITLFLLLRAFIPSMTQNFIDLFRNTYISFSDFSGDILTLQNIKSILLNMIINIARTVAPILLVGTLVGLAVNLLQVGWKITLKPLAPKFSRLNPVQGFKRIFSMQALFELVKALIKIVIILLISYNTLRGKEETLLVLYDMNFNQSIAWIGNLVLSLGIKIGLFFVILASIDYFYQFFKHEKELKMSKQEIKEEYKMTEGNPEIKGKIKQKMREMSLRRMMQDLPKADVVITNPTHFAVAIKYDNDKNVAPVVIAKGADLIAAKIRETAKEHSIEIVENKPLARMLYYNVDIGEEIPPELYQSVAEVLAFVYSLKQS